MSRMALMGCLLLTGCGAARTKMAAGQRLAPGLVDLPWRNEGAAGWTKLGRLEPGSWRAWEGEGQQTFDEYVAFRPRRPSPEQRTVCIQPYGEAAESVLRICQNYLKCFLQLPTTVLDSRATPEGTMREEGCGFGPQHHTDKFHTDLREGCLRRRPDAIAVMGVTTLDIYSGSFNYVFGEAYKRGGIGVCSVARAMPTGKRVRGAPHLSLDLRRLLKVVSHEVVHIFGLPHCARYYCVMNGYIDLSELDRAPMHLCPPCLKKLQWCLGFSHERRFRELAEFHGGTPASDWDRRWYRRLAMNKWTPDQSFVAHSGPRKPYEDPFALGEE